MSRVRPKIPNVQYKAFPFSCVLELRTAVAFFAQSVDEVSESRPAQAA